MNPRAAHLIADQLQASAAAYFAAVNGPSADAEAEAGDQLAAMITAATAILRTAAVEREDHTEELPPGTPVLSLHTTGDTEPAAILRGTIVREVAEPSSPTRHRRFLVALELPPSSGHRTRAVGADHLIRLTSEPSRSTL
ncbi:MAG: hypothetical protein H5T78_02950 [Nocardia sp.]|nr:hypothetical protein [Nocardia sp.]